MKNLVFTLLLFIAMLSQNISAQQEIIKLWSDAIPGSTLNPSYVETSEKGTDDITRVFRVSDPELIVYPAAEDKATGAAVIICPGGGYRILAIDHEGYNIAKWLNELGITAFILKYRLPSDMIMMDKETGPLQDAIKAMRIVRENAKKWNVNPDKIGVMGFSAGGHLASTLSTHYNEKLYTSVNAISARPDFSILIYPVISMEPSITHMGSRTNLLGKAPTEDKIRHFSNDQMVNKNTPPAFLVHAADDEAVPAQNSINYFLALKQHSIPVEVHIYEKGGHGFGMKKSDSTTSYWPEDCEHWLKMHKLIE